MGTSSLIINLEVIRIIFVREFLAWASVSIIRPEGSSAYATGHYFDCCFLPFST